MSVIIQMDIYVAVVASVAVQLLLQQDVFAPSMIMHVDTAELAERQSTAIDRTIGGLVNRFV